jgi:hypothetical protein
MAVKSVITFVPGLNDIKLYWKALGLQTLDWPKRFALDKHSSLLDMGIWDEEKRFYSFDTMAQCYKTF